LSVKARRARLETEKYKGMPLWKVKAFDWQARRKLSEDHRRPWLLQVMVPSTRVRLSSGRYGYGTRGEVDHLSHAEMAALRKPAQPALARQKTLAAIGTAYVAQVNAQLASEAGALVVARFVARQVGAVIGKALALWRRPLGAALSVAGGVRGLNGP